MGNEIFYTLFLIAFLLLGLVLRTVVKSSVQESVKHEFEIERQKMREDFEREMAAWQRKDKFRLAALDEKLRVHQKAFCLARELCRTIRSSEETKSNVLKRCEEFWDQNCLYLSNEARIKFREALMTYHIYDSYVESWKISKTRTELTEAFDRIMRLPDIIAKGTDLEAMGDEGQPSYGNKIMPDDSMIQAE